jgi:hypothetical protein
MDDPTSTDRMPALALACCAACVFCVVCVCECVHKSRGCYIMKLAAARRRAPPHTPLPTAHALSPRRPPAPGPRRAKLSIRLRVRATRYGLFSRYGFTARAVWWWKAARLTSITIYTYRREAINRLIGRNDACAKTNERKQDPENIRGRAISRCRFCIYMFYLLICRLSCVPTAPSPASALAAW